MNFAAEGLPQSPDGNIEEYDPLVPRLTFKYLGKGQRPFVALFNGREYQYSAEEIRACSFFDYTFSILNKDDVPKEVLEEIYHTYDRRELIKRQNEILDTKHHFDFDPNRDLITSKNERGKLYERICCYLLQRMNDFTDLSINVFPVDAETDAFKKIDFVVQVKDVNGNIMDTIPVQLEASLVNTPRSERLHEIKIDKLEATNEVRRSNKQPPIKLISLFEGTEVDRKEVDLDKNIFSWLFLAQFDYHLLSPVHHFFKDIEGAKSADALFITLERLAHELLQSYIAEKHLGTMIARLKSRLSKEVRDRTKVEEITAPAITLEDGDRVAFLDESRELIFGYFSHNVDNMPIVSFYNDAGKVEGVTVDPQMLAVVKKGNKID